MGSGVQSSAEVLASHDAPVSAEVLTLEVHCGDDRPVCKRFCRARQRTIKIGSLASADLRLTGTGVARVHAAITLAPSGVQLIDMGARTGTRLNGHPVHNARLHDGDEITIGDVVVRVYVGDRPKAKTPAPAPKPEPMPEAAPVVSVIPDRRPAVAPRQPRFDPSPAPVVPLRRVDSRRLRAPAVSGAPHPALPPEGVATIEAHALEMRVFWGEGLLNIHHFVEPRRITIGETRRATVFISSEGLPVDEFPLIRFVDERYVLTVTAAMEGEVELGGVVTPLAETGLAPDASLDDDVEGAWFVPLTIGDRAIVHWGGTTFAFRFVPPPRRVPNPLLRRLEPHYVNMLLLSLFFHLTLIVTLMVHPGEVRATPPRRFFDAVVELYPDVASADIRPAPVPRREEPAKNWSPQGPAPVDKRKGSRRHATRRADEASVQRSLGRMLGSDSRLLGPGGGTLFGHIANAIGTHGRDGIQVGLRGFGTRGGPALGAFGELRHAGPIETGLPGLGADPGLGDRPERGVLTVERPDVRDPLARDMIQKVVQQNRRQIRFCYERVLHREHELEGKVAVAWVIGGTGEVVEAFIVESTLDSREVERCMIDRIRRWRFPAPAGGGTVRVNYPFVFHAT